MARFHRAVVQFAVLGGWLALFAASCTAEEQPSTPSARDVFIDELSEVRCSVHKIAMGLRPGETDWIHVPVAGGMVPPLGYPPYSRSNRQSTVLSQAECELLGGEANWYFDCLSCTLEPDPEKEAPIRSKPPWKYWKNERCSVHDLRLTPVVSNTSSVDSDYWQRLQSIDRYPNCGSNAFSRLEVTVDGTTVRWLASCYKCDEIARAEMWARLIEY